MAYRVPAIFALAILCVAAGVAFARGPDMSPPTFATAPFGFESPQSPPHFTSSRASYDDGEAPRRRHKRSSGAASFGYGKPVCVRLCDGSFFPTLSATGGEAACAAECPDSPTALYTMPTENIDDAVSSTGAPYTKLPVANRYRTSFEPTCVCHRPAASRTRELLADPTLRKGDVVMTPDGFRVYEGSGSGPTSERDFVLLAKAPNVPKTERATLTAMERTSAGSPTIARPQVVVARPKGNVTVDDGSPAPNP